MNGSFQKLNLEKLPKKTGLVEQGHILQDWFVFRDNRHFGPLSSKQVRGFLSKKLISTEHYLWRPGFDGWTSIKDVEGFKSYGKSKIKAYTDEEFSYKAKLNYIDRISQEARSLDFTEGQKPISAEESLAELEKNKNPFIKGLEGVSQYFGFGETYVNYGRVAGFILAILVTGAMVYKSQGMSYQEQLSLLPDDVRQSFVKTASSFETSKNPRLSLYELNEGGRDPEFVGAINAPVGTKIRLEVSGIQGTLVGAYRFEYKRQFEIKSKIFKTDAVRQASGKFLPAGQYIVKAYCVNCTEPNKELYKQEQLLGTRDFDVYEKDLRVFTESAREEVRLELDELEDLSYTLFNQYKATSDRFMQGTADKKIKRWQSFSAQWLNKQNKLLELFQQLKTSEFSEKLYYLGIYSGYAKVVKQIFELHMMQDNLMPSKNRNIASMSPLVKKIDINLKALKAQVELARVKFNQTDGVPKVEKIDI